MRGQVLVPKFRPPRRITRGALDGLPDYIVATRDSPHCFTPPYGKRLIVYQNDERLWHVVEANRREGWAIGLHYETDDKGHQTIIPRDGDGIAQHRAYHGRIAFRLERV